MTNVTNCPNCQKKFVVTDEQLSKHNGIVRCRGCSHVFNAKKVFLVKVDEIESTEVTTNSATDINKNTSKEKHKSIITNKQEKSWLISDETNKVAVHNPLIKDSQASYFEQKKEPEKSHISQWLTGLFALLLFLLILTQCLYFWRSDIVIYYPSTRPWLTEACQQLNCQIELPRKIEFIMIDDSDIQEDADHDNLIHLSSNLINQANFTQAYPNIELTLTDIEDKAKLRRIFKPVEYLPEDTDIEKGMAAGEEVKLKLALTAQGYQLTGYRIAVSY